VRETKVPEVRLNPSVVASFFLDVMSKIVGERLPPE
jgi:hypothetical protein